MSDKIALIDSLLKINDLAKLETEYHKLKGTGRTYGLPEFTQLGATLERICELDPSSLKVAVPLSLSLMSRMRDARVQDGSCLNLDTEPDFQVLLKMVTKKIEAGD